LQAIRTEWDADWLEDPDGSRPRDVQLTFIFPGLGLRKAQPLTHKGSSERDWWHTAQRMRRVEETRDDPAVCPPAMPGQLLLIKPRRTLEQQMEQRIRDRPMPDRELVESLVASQAAGRGETWKRRVAGLARLLLAVREADGGGPIPVEALDDLPALRPAVADVLQQAGLLDAPSDWTPSPMLRGIRQPRPRSCLHCQAWGFGTRCPGCRGWRDKQENYDTGDCTRCQCEDVLLREGLCRGCCLDISLHGIDTREQTWRQLMLGAPFTFKTTIRHAYLRHEPGTPGSQPYWKRPQAPPRTVSEHRLAPGQEPLFPMRRDWSRVGALPLAELPALTPGDDELIAELQAEMEDQQWSEGPLTYGLRSLRVLASWLGTEAPIPEEDIQALAVDARRGPGPRLAQFLDNKGLLIPAVRKDAAQHRVEALLAEYTGQIADELRLWVTVLRGGGRWEHPATTWATIRRYLTYLRPVLTGWSASGISTLREISRDDMRAVLDTFKGRSAEAVHVASRSLFRALKQERVVFTDPTRGLTVATVRKVPRAISSDLLKGVIDRTPSPAGQFVVALVAVHALGASEITRLMTSELDLSKGRLTVRRPGRRHLIYLDEFTHGLAADWLRERHRRWPLSSNPHLIVSQISAMDANGTAVSPATIKYIFRQLGLNSRQVRIDRIFHEAQLTADPLHLIRLFGISEVTAVRYVQAAHPERTAKPLH
jgi:integrase